MRTSHLHVCPIAVVALLALVPVPPVVAQQAPLTEGGTGTLAQRPVIWEDRGDLAGLDLTGGAGGTAHEPGTEFVFIKESKNGTSPKFDAKDDHGTKWKVKIGQEARSETAASRLVWAAGYIVDEDYYRPQIHVSGLPRLTRGNQFVSPGGVVTGARLERESKNDASENWSWYDNPLVGTREFNGLRVMMALVNNWDLKAVNNEAAGTTAGGRRYRIADLGATFGRTGNSLTRSKGIAKDYADTRFVEKVTPTYVDLSMHSRPFFLSIVNFRNYRFRSRMERVAKHIPIADAIWIGERLGHLSAEQIGDAFRASGYPPADVEAYTRVVMSRIEALKALEADSVIPPEARTAATRCLDSTCRQVPLRETLTAIDLGTAHARAIVGGFEQGAGIAGGVQLSSAAVIPGVEFRATALTSTARYRRFDLEMFLPNIGGSRTHADIWFSDLHRETEFFGIGPQSSMDLQTRYAIARQSYQATVYRDIANHLQAGVYSQVMDALTTDGKIATNPPMDQMFSGTQGALIERWVPGFLLRTRVLSYGGFLAYDTRDDRVGLTRGVNLYGRLASAGGLGDSSGYGWSEKELDARGYIPLGGPRTSLLVRTRAQLKTPRRGDQIPFSELSWLGGREYLRGYGAYRFRGNNMLLLSSELQRTMFAMTPTRGIDAFASADTGQVWGDARSATDPVILDNQAFHSRDWRSGLGGGVQYRHSRAFAARVEVSRSHERSTLYASLTRGF